MTDTPKRGPKPTDGRGPWQYSLGRLFFFTFAVSVMFAAGRTALLAFSPAMSVMVGLGAVATVCLVRLNFHARRTALVSDIRVVTVALLLTYWLLVCLMWLAEVYRS